MRSESQQELGGRTAIVTGSVGSGIGRSIALGLAAAGANVVLNHGTRGDQDRVQAVRQLLDAIAPLPGRAIHVVADTRTAEGISRLLAGAADAFGPADILVNNAGAPWLEQDFAAIDEERWVQTLAAEVVGPSLLIKGVLPSMRRRRWGRIINITIDFMTLGVLLDHEYAHRQSRFPFPFGIGKKGRSELTRLLAPIEWRHGITINNILPGIIEDMTLQEAVSAAQKVPDAPLTTPADIAALAVLLCTDAMRQVTGSDIVMPGNVFARVRGN